MEDSAYHQNLDAVLSDLSSQGSKRPFHNSTAGDVPNKIYGLYQCRGDVSQDVCSECIQDATKKIVQECPLFVEAAAWYDKCMLRYDNQSIFSMSETYPGQFTWSRFNVSDYHKVGPVLAETLNSVINDAAQKSSKGHFATKSSNWTVFDYVYCLAQCTPDLTEFDCKNCLTTARSTMVNIFNTSTLVSIYLASCQLSYDMTQQFYLDTSHIPPTSSTSNVIELDALGEVEFVHYDFATLKAATGDFSADNKLGEGGFGIVYLGKLNSGQEVAIKRLSGNSGQGTDEFMTEAHLVAKLQHKNLVKLLGSCSEGNEKLLVYEFLPNTSVDSFLFDPTKRLVLDWETRYKIIMGVARGIQYLHEDSRLTIIHRDLKTSNILLDIDMTPKIADFGTARLFKNEQVLANTIRIVGTRGYMAPEYMLNGEYSDKSDVYSFGIIILELISGQKNRVLYQSSQREDLPILAWMLWNVGRSFEFLDSILVNNCSEIEVIRCIQVGLLCVQQNAAQRPTMATAVLMLTGSIALPPPIMPAMSPHHFNLSISPDDDGRQNKQLATKSVAVWSTDFEKDMYPR
ncbi:Cysteine-rich receptor-like protein kinase 10 [Bienertia sinuspersici]